jgi:hypothetical protein
MRQWEEQNVVAVNVMEAKWKKSAPLNVVMLK